MLPADDDRQGTERQYDHILYPGAVSRSMIPSLILALTTYPLSTLGHTIGLIQTQTDVQTLGQSLLSPDGRS